MVVSLGLGLRVWGELIWSQDTIFLLMGTPQNGTPNFENPSPCSGLRARVRSLWSWIVPGAS